MEWVQPENREISGTDLMKNRGSALVGQFRGYHHVKGAVYPSVLMLVQMMDIIMLVHVVGLYTELHTSAIKLCNLGADSLRKGGGGAWPDASHGILGTDQDNNWVYAGLTTHWTFWLANKQWLTTLDLVSRYWQVSPWAQRGYRAPTPQDPP